MISLLPDIIAIDRGVRDLLSYKDDRLDNVSAGCTRSLHDLADGHMQGCLPGGPTEVDVDCRMSKENLNKSQRTTFVCDV